MLPVPHSKIEKLNNFADDISTFSRVLALMLQFKLFSAGNETFMQILTLSVCGIAKIEFALRLGTGGLKNGPATKPFLIQVAMESVTSEPCTNAALEFFTAHGPRLDFWKAGAPFVK